MSTWGAGRELGWYWALSVPGQLALKRDLELALQGGHRVLFLALSTIACVSSALSAQMLLLEASMCGVWSW